MKAFRQDAWSEDEDKLLAEVVLSLIKEGRTQLQAFEEVGKQLTRTSAACGFRWNSFVRKQYKAEIELAKEYKKQLKKGLTTIEDNVIEQKDMQNTELEIRTERDFEEVIEYLKIIYRNSLMYENNLDRDENKVRELEETVYNLISENKKLEIQLSQLSTSYKALVELMEKAREMVVFERRT
ncbi:RsfA family transcriptional regulator [Niallia taxi]|uniref:RsfA family transcriptional regulator n=1 Tax=Niallia taxi TaxID=2499688 RepID=UPI00398248A3